MEFLKDVYYLCEVVQIQEWALGCLGSLKFPNRASGFVFPNLRGTKGWPCQKCGYDISAGSWGSTLFYLPWLPVDATLTPSVVIPVINQKTPGRCNVGVSSVLLLLFWPVGDLSSDLSSDLSIYDRSLIPDTSLLLVDCMNNEILDIFNGGPKKLLTFKNTLCDTEWKRCLEAKVESLKKNLDNKIVALKVWGKHS